MAEEPDRLSQLPDELLQHILHLAPCREAVTTGVLSRRWRGLWPLPTGAVKIDIPSRDAYKWLHVVEEALAASRGPVERLAIDVLGVGCDNYVCVLRYVLSHRASRGVHELRIRGAAADTSTTSESSSWSGGVPEFELGFGTLPYAALRVLHITSCNCNDLKPPPSSTFPCLEVLRLRKCNVDLQRLRDMVAASPQLAALQLEYVDLSIQYYNSSHLAQSFCCPGVTNLVLLNCFRQPNYVAIQLDMPRVQHFRYRGEINMFTLRSPLPDVRRAYLHILARNRSGDAETTCKSFWSFLWNFRNTEVLKLKLEWPIDHVAALERSRIRDLLIGENQRAQSIMFCVKHLEIDAPHNPESEDVGVAIGNLLQCCPALHDLTLKLNTADQPRNRSTSLQSQAQLDFHKSIDHFRRRRERPLCGDDDKVEVSHIPGLSDRWFHFRCLQFHLKRLSLQFHMDKDNPNAVGVQLIKFFIERGMALEKMYIDDGTMKLWEHLDCKISGYPANPQPFSEYLALDRMSQALSINQFSSSSMISGWFQPHKLEVRRTNPLSVSRSFTILPLADR